VSGRSPKVTCWGRLDGTIIEDFSNVGEKEEKAVAAAKIAAVNAGWTAEQKRMNDEWKKSEEWRQLGERGLKVAREVKAAAKWKGEKCEKTTQSFVQDGV